MYVQSEALQTYIDGNKMHYWWCYPGQEDPAVRVYATETAGEIKFLSKD